MLATDSSETAARQEYGSEVTVVVSSDTMTRLRRYSGTEVVNSGTARHQVNSEAVVVGIGTSS